MWNNPEFASFRLSRRQAIAAGIVAGLSTLFANRRNANAQRNTDPEAIGNPYDGISFPDGFTRSTTSIGDIELHHVTGGNPDAPVVLLWHGFLGNGYSSRKVYRF